MMEYIKDWRVWLMCLAVAFIVKCTDEAWGQDRPDLSEFGIIKQEKQINIWPTYTMINEAIAEHSKEEKEKSWYDKIIKLAEQYTSAKYDVNPDCYIQWKLNKINAEYRMGEASKLRWDAKVNSKGAETTLLYTISW